MKLIRSIEIKYFRSVHSMRIDKFGDMTVLSGRNDVGKSNILRAMNLFFNSQTDLDTPLSFERDFNYKRLREVRQVSVNKLNP